MVSTVTAVHGTSNTSWRSSQGEMLEEREKKSRKQQKQRRHSSAAVVEAPMQHCPSG